MEIGLGWLGLAVGCAGLVAACLADAAREEGETACNPWPLAAFATVITLVFWGVAMRGKPPFSPGQSLGYGFLIGGLAGVVAGLLASRLIRPEAGVRSRQMALLCMAFLGLFAASLAYLIFRGYPQWAMLGLGIGAAMTGILALSLECGLASTCVETFAAFTMTTSLAVVFAVAHFNQPGQRVWWPIPILVAATVGLAALVGIAVGALAKLRERPGRAAAISALVACVIVLGLGAIYAWRIAATWQLLWVVAAGIGVAAIAAWISWCAARTEDESSLMQAGAAAAVLAVALVVVAFKLWAGLGIALGLVAVWALAMPLLGIKEDQRGDAAPNAVRGILLFGLTVVLFRLFIELNRTGLGTTDLRIHYAFVGAILGALMPRVLVASGYKSPSGPWRGMAGIAFVGLVASAAPLILILIWGIKAVMGFVFGLTAAVAISYIESLKDATAARRMGAEAMFAVGAGLTATVFTAPLMQIEMTRCHRATVLVAAVIVAVLWLIISGGLTRRRAE